MNQTKPKTITKTLTWAATGILLITLLSVFLYATGVRNKKTEKKEVVVDVNKLTIDTAKAREAYEAILIVQNEEKVRRDSLRDSLIAFKDSVNHYQDSINAIVPKASKTTSNNYTVSVRNKVMKRVLQYESIVRLNALKFNLEPNMVFAMIHHESLGASDTVSSAGAIGLMAIMPKTGEEMGFSIENLKVPEKNIEAGCQYLRQLINQHGSIELALAMYEAGSRGIRNKIKRGENVAERPYIKYIYKRKQHYIALTAQNLISNS